MFTIEQLKSAHSKVKSGADFPNYVQDLLKLGVTYYETYVADGHTDYFGKQDYKISTEEKYDKLIIADNSNLCFNLTLKHTSKEKPTIQHFVQTVQNRA